MDDMETIQITVQMGAKMRKAREDRGLSQSELAAKVDASREQIDHYEKGDYGVAVSRLFDLVSELGLTIPDLFD